MSKLSIEIDEPVDGYAVYRVMDKDQKTILFKSSGPAFLVRELANEKLERIVKARASIAKSTGEA